MNQPKFYRHNYGFMANHNRRSKADKIIQVLAEVCEQRKTAAQSLLLDIGTGNGEIAHYLGERYDVVSLDITDQRTVHDEFAFVVSGDEGLPFSDRSFDLVVSNHVIEHMADANRHLSEIRRVLKFDGLAYLATPNRLWPWEVHNRIPFLHYLPATIFNSLLKSFGRYHEDIFPLTWWAIRRKAKRFFVVHIVSDRICKWPLKYSMQCHPFIAKILSCIPLCVYRICTFIHPTLVVVLKK
jgi:SAM-dependent methyltransferase